MHLFIYLVFVSKIRLDLSDTGGLMDVQNSDIFPHQFCPNMSNVCKLNVSVAFPALCPDHRQGTLEASFITTRSPFLTSKETTNKTSLQLLKYFIIIKKYIDFF